MKIGVVVDNEANYDKRVLREIEILKGNGYEIFLLCFGFNQKACSPIDGIKITRIRINKKIKDILFFFLNLIPVYEFLWSFAIKKFIIANSLGILHIHDLYMSKAGWSGIKKSGKRIPMILDLHENYPYTVTTYNWTKGLVRNFLSKPGEWQKKEKEYLGYAEKIIVLSDEFRDNLVERYPEFSKNKFAIMPNVPDLDQMEPKGKVSLKVNVKKGTSVILYFGIIAERRGIFDALEVFIQLAKENHHFVFLVIGPVDKKDRKRFFNYINSESLRERVYHVPWIDLSELPAYLEITDICIAPFHKNPQHESGIANKIFDYMLGKKPIVASDCRPQQKLIETYNCGLIYKNDKEMKEAITTLLSDKELCIRMGLNGYNAVMEEYNTANVKNQLLSLYKDLI
ncbi:MAG: glycosyltransferase family 4 protein [Bacteroidia bacterium]|nr:glycosyltransferase family 4 protein [Bacteroidia bacterium]